MAFLSGNISRGDVLECDFGTYKTLVDAQGNPILDANGQTQADPAAFNYRVPNEMQKRRAVLVIADHKGCYSVVPISSKEDTHKNPRKSGEARGFHVRLLDADMPVTHHYLLGVPRWAKANMIHTVDRRRLGTIHCQLQNRYVSHRVTDRTLKLVQEAVIRTIGRPELIP